MGLIEDYFKLQKKYEKIHGEKTIVLMQWGKFYEIFEYEADLDKSDKKMLMKMDI